MATRSAGSLSLVVRRAFRSPRPGIKNQLLPLRYSVAAAFICFFVILSFIVVYIDADFTVWKRAALKGPEALPGTWHVRWFFFRFTDVGKGTWILIFTALAALVLSFSKWRELKRPVLVKRISLYADVNFIFYTVAFSGIIAFLLKNLIGRARPKLLQEVGASHFDPVSFAYDYASLPSGHATTFGAFCMGLIILYPRWRWWFLMLAFMGGISRVIVDAHYLSDAFAGLALGAGFVILSARWLAQRGVMFKFNGRMTPHRRRPT